jgi:DNA-binding GntR family transcriptional regulator
MRSIDRTFREMSLEIDKDEPSRAFKEHSNILDAVKKGDSELAERLMNGHIRRVANSIMNISPE